MTVGSILLGMALIVLVGLFVARPFMLRPDRGGRLTSVEALQAHKEALLTHIRELDFDYETGKLPAEEHQRQRTLLMNEAAGILRQLDEMAEGKSQDGQGEKSQIPNPKSQITDSRLDDEIEAAVARLRQKQSSNGQVKFCPQCGKPTDPDDRFCAYCGHALRQRVGRGA